MGTPLIKRFGADLRIALGYLQHELTAYGTKGHGIHSPFVFDLLTNVFNDKAHYAAYDAVEGLRGKMLKDPGLLEVEDFGAGSAYGSQKLRSVASITRRAAKPRKYGQLLFRLSRYYRPHTVVELGTSLGLSTAYLAMGNPDAKVVTIEGASPIAQKAQHNFHELGLGHIVLRTGRFEQQLPTVLGEMASLDLVFIDGDHRKAATLNYFEQCLPFRSGTTLFIFDDIHWSAGMASAWKQICDDPRVMLSVDLYFMGLVFFNPSFRVKQHFRIRY